MYISLITSKEGLLFVLKVIYYAVVLGNLLRLLQVTKIYLLMCVGQLP